MSEELKQEHTGVVCVHCGMYTFFPDPTGKSLAARSCTTSTLYICLIRCTLCGKEARYLADEVIDFESASCPVSHPA